MDDTNVKNGKAKLPPLSPKGETDGESKPKKKVVKKKKKPAEEETPAEGDKPKATPRRKKAAASASSTAGDGGENATPKKKKKRVQKQTTDAEPSEGDPTSARSGGSQGEDVSGSKASLIKSPKDDTPRKKKVKKKVKKTPEKSEGDIFDSTLADDLTAIEDDVITEEPKKDMEKKQQPYTTASAILRSVPTEKFYIETNSGFKGENKNRFAKRQAEEEAEKAIVHEKPKRTTIEFAISTHKVLRTILLFCHGLLAGICLWHIVMSYILLDYGEVDFIEHYHRLSLPVNSIFYFLLVLCTVSACDRFDVGNPRRSFVLKALTLQNGTVSVIIYFAALLISVANIEMEDKINLYYIKPQIWSNNTDTMSEELTLWRDLNTSRNCLSILGWFIISLAPMADRLTDNLRHTDEEDLLGVEVDTNKSMA